MVRRSAGTPDITHVYDLFIIRARWRRSHGEATGFMHAKKGLFVRVWPRVRQETKSPNRLTVAVRSRGVS